MKNNQKIIIFGTGGFALELSHLFKDDYNILGFVGHKPKINLPFKYLGTDRIIKSIPNDVKSVIAIGDIFKREEIYNKIKKNNKKIGSLIHNLSYFSNDIKISEGLICYPNTTIHAGSKIGICSIINSNSTIGHETIIKKFVNISPGVSIGGSCVISNYVNVGIGTTIINNIKITQKIYVGAGSLIIKNLTKEGLYFGLPAEYVKNII